MGETKQIQERFSPDFTRKLENIMPLSEVYKVPSQTMVSPVRASK